MSVPRRLNVYPLTLIPSHQRQNVQEEVHNIKVKVERSEDVLLGRDGQFVVASDHELGVEDQVEWEEKRPETSVDDVEHPVVHDGRDDAEGDENEEQHVEQPAHEGEVPFGLRERREGRKNVQRAFVEENERNSLYSGTEGGRKIFGGEMKVNGTLAGHWKNEEKTFKKF